MRRPKGRELAGPKLSPGCWKPERERRMEAQLVLSQRSQLAEVSSSGVSTGAETVWQISHQAPVSLSLVVEEEAPS